MATKRAYKLQEFVAHTSNVNCVKFGRRTSRVLITGGEDRKVNLWAVGKPNALLSLTGLTSPVESVSFDSSEVTIGAGAASGTIKIWDVEEAKNGTVVRTFTGHRSNCASLDFHPFGEFLASGSSDTNMKIWDIRKKRCIHTYKGHSRRIDVLKFTPDGRWIVSAGADNSVKLWDLTAGKLLHDFNHQGPVNCLDFHPHEFLLATGSTDKTVKFWDLETFELIGSSCPENSREYFVMASVVRSMKFNLDGKTLFCGLHESLKVLSWEPVICHDVVDVGWSTLADLTVDDGKLLGCSYNQNCVGVWVVDLWRTELYAAGSAESHLTGSLKQADASISSVFDRLSFSRYSGSEVASATQLKRSMSASKETLVSTSSTLCKRLSKEPRAIDLQLTRSDSVPLLSHGVILEPNIVDDGKRQRAAVESLPAASEFSSKVNHSSNAQVLSHHPCALAAPAYKPRPHISTHSNKASSSVHILAPRHSSNLDVDPIIDDAAKGDLSVMEPQSIIKGDSAFNNDKDGKLIKIVDSRSSNKDVKVGCRSIIDDVECDKVIPVTSLPVNVGFDFRMRAPENQNVHEHINQSKPISTERKYIRETSSHEENNLFRSVCTESVYSNEVGNWHDLSGFEKRYSAAGRKPEFVHINRSAMIHFPNSLVGTGPSSSSFDEPSSSSFDNIQYERTVDGSRWQASLAGRQTRSTIEEDAMAVLMENHQEFVHVMKSRKLKLEEAYWYWCRNDNEFVDAMLRTSDCAVTADVICILMENSNCITLDTCTSLLRLASSLLESTYDWHLIIALDIFVKLVKRFGATISSTLSAAAPIGVDLEAERRMELCDLCLQELKKLRVSLVSLTRRQDKVGRSAQELSLFLQEIFQLANIQWPYCDPRKSHFLW